MTRAAMTHRSGRRLTGLAILMALAGFAASGCSSSPSTTSPQVNLSITPAHGSATSHRYTSGELLTIHVGPNKLFKPYLKVNILECADPGGSPEHLPKSIANCDGNTIQGGTVLINKDGSFSAPGYEVFALPNSVLGEQANWQPVCDLSHPCVLYIGENQEDFNSWPKVFSAPFTVKPAPVGH